MLLLHFGSDHLCINRALVGINEIDIIRIYTAEKKMGELKISWQQTFEQ